MLNNVPLTGQSLGQTRSPINANFATIDTAFTVNSNQPQHVPYNDSSGNQGMHNFVQFPVYAGATNPPAFTTGQLGFFNLLLNSNNELYIHKNSGNNVSPVNIPFTYSLLSTVAAPAQGTAGFTYLPSGIIVQWGSSSANGLSGAISYPIPFPTQVFNTEITTAYANSSDGDGFVRLNTQSRTSFTVYASARTTVTNKSVAFNFIAIGY